MEIRGGDIRGVRAHVLRDGEALSPEIAADQVGVQHSGEGRAQGEREEDLRRRLRPRREVRGDQHRGGAQVWAVLRRVRGEEIRGVRQEGGHCL